MKLLKELLLLLVVLACCLLIRAYGQDIEGFCKQADGVVFRTNWAHCYEGSHQITRKEFETEQNTTRQVCAMYPTLKGCHIDCVDPRISKLVTIWALGEYKKCPAPYEEVILPTRAWVSDMHAVDSQGRSCYGHPLSTDDTMRLGLLPTFQQDELGRFCYREIEAAKLVLSEEWSSLTSHPITRSQLEFFLPTDVPAIKKSVESDLYYTSPCSDSITVTTCVSTAVGKCTNNGEYKDGKCVNGFQWGCKDETDYLIQRYNGEWRCLKFTEEK